MIQVEHELCLFLDPESSGYIFLFLLYKLFFLGGEGGSKSSLDIFFVTITPPHSPQ